MVVLTDGARMSDGRVLLLFMAVGRGAHDGAGVCNERRLDDVNSPSARRQTPCATAESQFRPALPNPPCPSL